MQPSQSRLSIVMITQNRALEVLCSLGHLAALPERPEIILVDNGSTDGTRSLVSERFPSVRVIALSNNLGAAGRSIGVEQARTPFVAFCDDDTWWEPGSLSHAVCLFDRHPRLAILTGRILVGPEDREDPICAELARSPLPGDPGLPGHPLLGFMAGASIIRRDAFLDAGGFEPRFLIGGEEELLALDLAVRGWSLRYVPELIVHHHPSAHRDVAARRSDLLRNALWSTWLRRPLASALRRSIELVKSSPRDRASLLGCLHAFSGLPWIIRKRRVVPTWVERDLRLLEATRKLS